MSKPRTTTTTSVGVDWPQIDGRSNFIKWKKRDANLESRSTKTKALVKKGSTVFVTLIFLGASANVSMMRNIKRSCLMCDSRCLGGGKSYKLVKFCRIGFIYQAASRNFVGVKTFVQLKRT